MGPCWKEIVNQQYVTGDCSELERGEAVGPNGFRGCFQHGRQRDQQERAEQSGEIGRENSPRATGNVVGNASLELSCDPRARDREHQAIPGEHDEYGYCIVPEAQGALQISGKTVERPFSIEKAEAGMEKYYVERGNRPK